MSANVLVAYASKYGSTQGVAERIAEHLRLVGADVELRPCEEVADLSDYDAVVFGSPVFDGRWTPVGEQFIEAHESALAALPVWLFSVGSFGDTKRLIGPMMKREPKNISAVEQAIHPREYRVFAGVIDRHRWPLASRMFFHALGGRFGDNRDWHEIEAWADRIAAALPAHPSATKVKGA